MTRCGIKVEQLYLLPPSAENNSGQRHYYCNEEEITNRNDSYCTTATRTVPTGRREVFFRREALVPLTAVAIQPQPQKNMMMMMRRRRRNGLDGPGCPLTVRRQHDAVRCGVVWWGTKRDRDRCVSHGRSVQRVGKEVSLSHYQHPSCCSCC